MAISMVMLGVDFLAEKGSRSIATRHKIRRALLIDLAEALANYLVSANIWRVFIWAVLVLIALAILPFIISIALKYFFASSTNEWTFPTPIWIAIVLLIIYGLGSAQSRN